MSIAHPVVVAPVRLGKGGLGTAAAEFFNGLAEQGLSPAYIGPQSGTRLTKILVSRPYRRAFGMATARRFGARHIRREVPRDGWDLAYALPGTVPVERGSGIRVVCQATRHPAVEYSALRRGERETGARGDMSRGERRRREYELARADLVHVTSMAVRDQFVEAGFAPERLVHSYHGVDLSRFVPGAKGKRLKIVFVGPLSLRKGVDTVAELKATLPGDVRLVTIGGASDTWSRRIAEEARFERAADVADELRDAHLLVLPSRSDGFSYVVLEALASGTLPIVTPEVGAAEIVRRLDPRLVVERHDFVEATLDLLDRLDYRELAPRARALAEEFDRNLTSRAVAEKVLAAADSLRG